MSLYQKIIPQCFMEGIGALGAAALAGDQMADGPSTRAANAEILASTKRGADVDRLARQKELETPKPRPKPAGTQPQQAGQPRPAGTQPQQAGTAGAVGQAAADYVRANPLKSALGAGAAGVLAGRYHMKRSG